MRKRHVLPFKDRMALANWATRYKAEIEKGMFGRTVEDILAPATKATGLTAVTVTNLKSTLKDLGIKAPAQHAEGSPLLRTIAKMTRAMVSICDQGGLEYPPELIELNDSLNKHLPSE